MQLSKGEKAYLVRRRSNRLATEVAAEYGVGPDVVTDWERNRRTHDVPPARLRGGLRPGEALVILRRRRGFTVYQAARRAGVARSTWMGWERGRGDWKRGLEVFQA